LKKNEQLKRLEEEISMMRNVCDGFKSKVDNLWYLSRGEERKVVSNPPVWKDVNGKEDGKVKISYSNESSGFEEDLAKALAESERMYKENNVPVCMMLILFY